MSDRIDQAIRAYLQSKPLSDSRDATYPDTETYYRFVMDELQGEKLQRMLDFLKRSPEDQRFVLSLRKMSENAERANAVAVPQAWMDRAKGIRKGKSSLATRRLLNAIWLVLAAASFGASFIFKQYFLQCLALALFFGFKWVIDLRQTKTQILVYKALQQSSDDDKHSRLHQHKRPL